MPTPSSADLVAELAHRLWCLSMLGRGWSPGPVHDPGALVHDALAPYERLDEQDRRLLRRAVVAEGMEAALMALVDHQRGPDRELAPEEMRVGLAVGWAAGWGDEHEIGRLVAWEIEGDKLTLVRVRWADEELSEHCPAERELRRLEA